MTSPILSVANPRLAGIEVPSDVLALCFEYLPPVEERGPEHQDVIWKRRCVREVALSWQGPFHQCVLRAYKISPFANPLEGRKEEMENAHRFEWGIGLKVKPRFTQKYPGSARVIAFFPKGETTLAILSSWDGDPLLAVNLLNTETGQSQPTLQGMNTIASAISPNGKIVAVSVNNNTVELRNILTNELLHTLSNPSDIIRYHCRFSSNGEIFAAPSYDGTVYFWNVATGELIKTLNGIDSWQFSPDGEAIAAIIEKAGKFWLWDSKTGGLLWDMAPRDPVRQLFSFAFSPDGRVVAIGFDCTDGSQAVEVKDVQTSNNLWTVRITDTEISSYEVSPNGEAIAVQRLDLKVDLWRKNQDVPVLSIDNVNNFLFSPNGKTFVTRGCHNGVKLWDIKTGRLIRTLEDRSNGLRDYRFSPNGEVLATQFFDGTIKLWDSTTGRLLQILTQSDGIESLQFSPDGQTIATQSCDGSTIQLWRPLAGKIPPSLEQRIQSIVAEDQSEDG